MNVNAVLFVKIKIRLFYLINLISYPARLQKGSEKINSRNTTLSELFGIIWFSA